MVECRHALVSQISRCQQQVDTSREIEYEWPWVHTLAAQSKIQHRSTHTKTSKFTKIGCQDLAPTIARPNGITTAPTTMKVHIATLRTRTCGIFLYNR